MTLQQKDTHMNQDTTAPDDLGRRRFGKLLIAAAGVSMTGLGFSATQVRAEGEGKMNYASSIDITAPAQKVWDTFKTFGRIDGWHPATENCALLVGKEGEALAVREFGIKGGGFVISELLAYDEAGMNFDYRIIKTDLPLKNYVARMWVVDNGNGSVTVNWEATFQHPNLDAATQEENDATMGLVQGVFKAGLDSIAALATA